MRDYFSKLHRDSCLEESPLLFCSTLTSCKFLVATVTLFSTATSASRAAYPLLKPNLVLAWIFFKSSVISFFSSRNLHPLFSSTRLETSRLVFLLACLTPAASQSCSCASFYSFCSVWSLVPLSFPARLVSVLVNLLLIKFCIFLAPFSIGFTNASWL